MRMYMQHKVDAFFIANVICLILYRINLSMNESFMSYQLGPLVYFLFFKKTFKRLIGLLFSYFLRKNLRGSMKIVYFTCKF
jgi:hypothetical protein